MAESSFFFTSSGGDRKYTSGNFATFFYELTQRGEGVIKSIDNELQVTNPGTLSVNINTGTSVKRGYLYNNSTSLNKALDAVTSGSQRIDRIVTRVDLTARTMSVVIIKGTESASPSAPSIDGTTDVLLAKILVNNTSGTPVYTVTDERVYRTAIASIGGMTAADALSGVTPSTVGKSMLSAADQAAQQTLITAGAVGIAALNAVSLTTVTGFKAADTANVAGTTPGARGLTALSQATTLDADTVVGLSGVPVGSIALHGSTTVPTGWLACDGSSSASRTTYATLFAAINPTIGTFTASVANPTVVTLASHGLISGDVIYLTTTATLPTGLTANTQLYWVTVINSSTFNVSTTFANYLAGTKVQVTGSGSGTHTARRCPWGLGDGSTTFTLPDLRLTAQGIPNATAAVGGWTAYTPAILGFTTPTNVDFLYRRVGSSVEIKGKFTTGVAQGVEAQIPLPPGLTSLSTVPTIETVGMIAIGGTSASSFYVLNEASKTYLTIGEQGASQSGLTKDVGTGLFAGGTGVSLYASVPIAQWTTNNNLVTYVIKY